MATLHQIQRHPEYVEGCFGCKVSTQHVGYCGRGGQDATRQKRWDAELALYREAKSAGIQPETTQGRGIRKAIDWSEKTGVAYTAESKIAHDTNTVLERYAV